MVRDCVMRPSLEAIERIVEMYDQERRELARQFHEEMFVSYLQTLNRALLVTNFVGLALSFYTFLVKWRLTNEEGYVAMCDISENISCTKAFMSPYGKGFGIIGAVFGEDSILNVPNYVSGMIFYSLLMLLGAWDNLPATTVLLWLSLVSNITSVYLAYVLYFVLYDLCIICVLLYLVNAANYALALSKLNHLQEARDDEKKK